MNNKIPRRGIETIFTTEADVKENAFTLSYDFTKEKKRFFFSNLMYLVHICYFVYSYYYNPLSFI